MHASCFGSIESEDWIQYLHRPGTRIARRVLVFSRYYISVGFISKKYIFMVMMIPIRNWLQCGFGCALASTLASQNLYLNHFYYQVQRHEVYLAKEIFTSVHLRELNTMRMSKSPAACCAFSGDRKLNLSKQHVKTFSCCLFTVKTIKFEFRFKFNCSSQVKFV